jgi:hypothetical protein
VKFDENTACDWKDDEWEDFKEFEEQISQIVDNRNLEETLIPIFYLTVSKVALVGGLNVVFQRLKESECSVQSLKDRNQVTLPERQKPTPERWAVAKGVIFQVPCFHVCSVLPTVLFPSGFRTKM